MKSKDIWYVPKNGILEIIEETKEHYGLKNYNATLNFIIRSYQDFLNSKK